MNNRKYRADKSRIVNRMSGESIPADEPVFILRAKDNHALRAITFYRNQCRNEEQCKSVDKVTQEFLDYRQNNPNRIGEPD